MTEATLMVVGELPDAVAHLKRSLERCRYTTTIAGSALAALERVDGHELDLVLVQGHLGGMGALQLCREIVRWREDLPVLIVGTHNGVEAAAARAAGAYDAFGNTIDDGELCFRVECALKRRQLEQSIRTLREVSRSWIGEAAPAR